MTESLLARIYFLGIAVGIFLLLLVINNQHVFGLLVRYPLLLKEVSCRSLFSENLRSISLALILIASMMGLGAIILRYMKFPLNTGLECLMAFALGAGLFGEGLFILGIAHQWKIQTLKIYTLILMAVSLFGWRYLLMQMPPLRLKTPFNNFSFRKSIFAGLFCYGLWHVCILSLAPPIEWDVITYHLVIPKLYLAGNGISEIPWLLHSHWPHLIELLYSLPLAWSLDTAAALIHLGFALGTMTAVFLFARREFNDLAAWISALVMLAQPLFLRFAGTAHVDAAWTFFSFLSLVCAWRWTVDKKTPWLLVAGLLSGLSVCTKLLASLEFIPLAVWIVSRADDWRGRLRFGGLFLLSGGLLIAPWILKTWLWTGNPIWPFASHWLGGSWGAQFIELPYRANFTWSGLPSKAWWTAFETLYTLAPLTLFVILARWKRLTWPPFFRFSVLIFIPHLIVLLHHIDFWRFIWPLLPTMCLTVGWAVSQLWDRTLRDRAMAGFGLAIVLFPLCRATQNYTLLPVLGIRSMEDPSLSPRDAYLRKSLNIFPASWRANRELAPTDKLLLYREMRGYYLDIPFVWGDPINQGLVVYRELKDDAACYQRLRQLGITHLFVNEANYTYDSRTTRLMKSVIDRYGEPMFTEGPVTLYRLHN